MSGPAIEPHRVLCPRCNGVGDLSYVSGASLRKRRQWAGVSLREMARRKCVSAPYLSDVELGRRTVGLNSPIADSYRRLSR